MTIWRIPNPDDANLVSSWECEFITSAMLVQLKADAGYFALKSVRERRMMKGSIMGISAIKIGVAGAAIFGAALMSSAQVSQDVETSLDIQVNTTTTFVVTGANTGSLNGSETDPIQLTGASGCLYSTASAVDLSAESSNAGALTGSSSVLRASNVNAGLLYLFSIRVRNDTSGTTNAGFGATFSLSGLDVSDPDCTAGDNVEFSSTILSNGGPAADPGDYSTYTELIANEGLADGELYTFTDTITITITPTI